MKTNPEPRQIPEAVRAELAALAEMADEDIDFSDIPTTTHEYWEGAVRGKFYRPAGAALEHGQSEEKKVKSDG